MNYKKQIMKDTRYKFFFEVKKLACKKESRNMQPTN